MTTTHVRDRWSGVFWLALSIFVCFEAYQIDIGTFHSPGPGFLPFWSSMIFGLFSITLIVTSFFRRPGEKRGERLWKGKNWSKVIIVLVSLFIYALLLPKLGYLLATFGLLALLFGIAGEISVWIRVLAAAFTALATYVLFYVWLGVQLPKGILGQ